MNNLHKIRYLPKILIELAERWENTYGQFYRLRLEKGILYYGVNPFNRVNPSEWEESVNVWLENNKKLKRTPFRPDMIKIVD